MAGMTEPKRLCPLSGHGRLCAPDCQLWQHENCAIANAAGALWGILQVLNRLTTKTEEPSAEPTGEPNTDDESGREL